jgi:DNA end-binding protein Ku
MRAVWTGSISFGLVNVPVRLYPAVSPKDPRFHQVDRETGRRVRYRRVVAEADPAEETQELSPASADREAITPARTPEESPAVRRAVPAEREVRYEDIVKGYEVAEGQQVVLEPEEIEALRPEPSRAIEIEHFVALREIDPVHFEKSYLVAPGEELAEKPYTLLRLAMERAGRVAIGRFVLRSREHLAAIRPTRGILGLETLYFADEVRQPPQQWQLAASVEVAQAELEMAEKLIEALAAEWEPGQYEDTYRRWVEDLIRQREPQKMPEEEEEAASGGRLPDLMAALKASVEALSEEPARPKRRKAGGAGRR